MDAPATAPATRNSTACNDSPASAQCANARRIPACCGAVGALALVLLTASCSSRIGSDQHGPAPDAVITPIGYHLDSASGSSGESITVRAGADVVLSGKDSDGRGVALKSFQWSQTGGPALPSTSPSRPDAGALLYRSSNTVSFRAPAVSAPTALGFQLQVTNAEGTRSTEQITVNVVPADDQNRFLVPPTTTRRFTVAVTTSDGLGTSTTSPLTADVPVCVRIRRTAAYTSRDGTSRTVPLPQLPSLEADASWAAGTVVQSATDITAAGVQAAVDSYSNPRVVFDIPSFNDEELVAAFNQPGTAETDMQLVASDIDSAHLQLAVTATPGSCDGTRSGSALAGSQLIVAILDNHVDAATNANDVVAYGPPGAAGQTAVLSDDDKTGSPITSDWLVTHVAYGQVIETAATAMAYYEAIDPNAYTSNDPKATLDGWLTANCFDPSQPDYGVAAAGSRAAHAVYTNNYDLGFGRDMYFMTCPSGNMAAVVFNYLSIEQAALRQGPLLAVAMEYSASADGSNAGHKFTKFYIYAPDDRTGQFKRVLGANFDRRGEKYLPGACTACHGGSPPVLPAGFTASARYPLLQDPTSTIRCTGGYPWAAGCLAPGDLDSAFLPWDLDSLLYSDTDPAFEGNLISKTGYTRADQEPHLKALNALAYSTYAQPEPVTVPSGSGTTRIDRFAAARLLIEKWYGGPGLPNATYCDTSACDGTGATPPGWSGQDALYHQVFARNCRTCHTVDAFPPNQFSGLLAGSSPNADLIGDGYPLLSSAFSEGTQLGKRYVFDQGIMPLARLTADRFWVRSDPSAASSAASVLASAFGIAGPDATVGSVHAAIAATIDGKPAVVETNLTCGAVPANSLNPGDTVRLSGSPSNFAAQYQWELSFSPCDPRFSSRSALVGSAGSEAAFSPDLPGIYTATLAAADGTQTDRTSAAFIVENRIPTIAGPTGTQPVPIVGTGTIDLTGTLGEGTCAMHTIQISAAHGTVSPSSGNVPADLCTVTNGNYTIALTYTPTIAGSDTLDILLTDALGNQATFSVSVDVTYALTAVQDSPTAVVNATTPTPICVLENDALEGQQVTLTVVGPPQSGGTVTVVPAGPACNGSPYLEYTPPRTFIGSDSFTYQITGPGADPALPCSQQSIQGSCSTAAVSVAISGTISFQTVYGEMQSLGCGGCHNGGAGATGLPFLPSTSSQSSYYQYLCRVGHSGATTGSCAAVSAPTAGTLADVGNPTASALYTETIAPPNGMTGNFAQFSRDVLLWISEGGYCTTTGDPCPGN